MGAGRRASGGRPAPVTPTDQPRLAGHDLDGKTFDPPRSADYDVVVSHIGWSQSVEVKVVDLAHPDVEVDPETFEGSTLVDLKVTVKNGEEEVDVVDWWLSPPSQ